MKNRTGYVLLGLLQEEVLTGYEMKKIINERMSFFWQESYGQIYPKLKMLLQGGYIETVTDESNEFERKKIKYKITEKGREELEKWMIEKNEKNSTRSECLLKLYLSNDDNVEKMKVHLKSFYQENKKQLELFKVFEKQLTEDINIHDNHRRILSVLSLGIKQQELYCEWSKELIDNMTQ
jgi:PadR family transcriptional regulator AphA